MREIKFRAWNGKRMLHYDSWFTLQQQHILCFEEGDEHSYVDDSDVDSPDRVELMQYIGLLDKNGMEIYEGDIVKLGNEVYPVVYKPSLFTVPYSSQSLKDHISMYDGIEVIGNIYEKPELLDKS